MIDTKEQSSSNIVVKRKKWRAYTQRLSLFRAATNDNYGCDCDDCERDECSDFYEDCVVCWGVGGNEASLFIALSVNFGTIVYCAAVSWLNK